MVAMALLLTVLAYRLLRNQFGGKPLASVVLAGALGLGMVSGVSGLRSANADGTPQVALGNAAGGTANVSYTGESEVINTSGVPQVINSILPVGSYIFVEPESAPQCTEGMVLTPGSNCFVYLTWDEVARS